MSESSLSITYDDIAKEVGYALSYGRDSAQWGSVGTADSQYNIIDICIQRGLRQFYNPPLLENESKSHVWTFLRPVTTLSTVSGTYNYTLPDNFGGIDGNFTYAANTAGSAIIPIVGEGQIRGLRANPMYVSNAKPRMAAIRPLASDGTTGQRFEALFHPTPDAIYVLSYRYYALQSKLLTGKYALGGMAHGETLLASCLYVAYEMLARNEASAAGLKSSAKAAWMDRLKASVNLDRETFIPENLGVNGDNSDGNYYFNRRDLLPVTTVNGVAY